MKPRLLSAAVICLLVSPVWTSASERQGAVSISPFIGGYSFDGLEHALTRPVYGVRAGYDLTRHWATEGLFHFVASEGTKSGTDFHNYSYRLDFLYNILPDRRLVPFVAAGGGGITQDRPGENDTDLAFNYGAGLKYFLTDSVAVRTDLRHLILPEGETRYNYEYTVGLSYLFGGEKAPMVGAAAAEPAQPSPAAPPSTATGAPPTGKEGPAPAAVPPAPEKSRYCISMNILFDIDQAVVKDEFRDEVAKTGTFMQKFPTTRATIYGHADEVGTEEHNQELSQRRAESVVKYLVEQFQIERARLTPVGCGKKCPCADNDTEAGKQRNRRTDAIIDCAIDIRGLHPVPDTICMTLGMEFSPGSSDIDPRYEGEIARIADFMKEHPEVTAIVEGHTDDTGTPQENMALSRKRAESVVNLMASRFGIEKSRLSAKAFGETRRVAYNTTPEGRAQNRRVSVILDCVVKK